MKPRILIDKINIDKLRSLYNDKFNDCIGQYKFSHMISEYIEKKRCKKGWKCNLTF